MSILTARAVKSKPSARYPPNVSDEGENKGNKKIGEKKKKKGERIKKVRLPPPSRSSSSLKTLPPPSKLRAIPRVSATAPLRGLAGRCFCVFFHRWACRPPDVCCSEEIEKRPAAPLVGEQPCGLGAVLAPGWSRELSSSPLRAALENRYVLTSLNLIHARYCPVRQCPVLSW